jgi:hypothetical protein
MPRAAHAAARRAGRMGLGSRQMIALHVMARSAARCASACCTHEWSTGASSVAGGALGVQKKVRDRALWVEGRA